jgi:hypothetical protein
MDELEEAAIIAIRKTAPQNNINAPKKINTRQT